MKLAIDGSIPILLKTYPMTTYIGTHRVGLEEDTARIEKDEGGFG